MDMRVWDLSRKREEEDNDMMLFIFLALHLLSSNGGRKKKRRHTSKLMGEEHIQELLEGHVKNYRVAFKMEPEIFRYLTNYLKTKRLIVDTRIKVEEKLAFFLYMLSHNASFEDLQENFGHSGDSFHHHIKAFLQLSCPFALEAVSEAPNPNEVQLKIERDPRFYPYFKNCLGAIDGTHIPISISADKAAPFRNRKNTLSQNAMIACDFDLNITFMSTGWEGLAMDARVLTSAVNKGFQVPPGKFYLVDGGYDYTPSFVSSYRKVKYHLKEYGAGRRRPQNYKELFNHRHAALWNHVERTLGVLKKRFPILKVATFHKIKNQMEIPIATVVFHNIIQSLEKDEQWLNNQPYNIHPRNYVDLLDGYKGNDQSIDQGNVLRDTIAHQMWNDYQQHRN